MFYLDGEIYLSQRDIRQVQLAKAAVRAGIDTMLLRNGLTPAQLDHALVAGSFGYHLTTRSLIDIGLFPAELDGKVSFVGNTARTGAEALLTNARGARNAAPGDQPGRSRRASNRSGLHQGFRGCDGVSGACQAALSDAA